MILEILMLGISMSARASVTGRNAEVPAGTVVAVAGCVVAMMRLNSWRSALWVRRVSIPVPHNWYTTSPRSKSPEVMKALPMKPTTRAVLRFIVHHDSGTFALCHGDG